MLEVENGKQKILVIDDEPDIANTLYRFFSPDFQVLMAFDGKSGLDLLEKEKPEIVLLDYRLPDMNGLEVLREIIAINPEIYVILMTGFGNEKILVDAFKGGVIDYFSKPFDLDRISEAIRLYTDPRTCDFRAMLRRKVGELEEMNRDVSAQNLLLKKLNLFSSEISGIFSMDQLIGSILRKVKEVSDPDDSFIMLFDATRSFLVPVTVQESQKFYQLVYEKTQILPEKIKISVTRDANPVNKALVEKKPHESRTLNFLFEGVEGVDKNKKISELFNIHQTHIFPILSSLGQPMGVLVNIYYEPPRVVDSRLKIKIMMNFISQASLALERNQKLQQVLNASDDRLDSLYETSAALIFAADPEQMVDTIISRINDVIRYDIFGIVFSYAEKNWLVIQILTPVSDDYINSAKEKLISSYEALTQKKIDRESLVVSIKKDKISSVGTREKKLFISSSLTAPMIVSDKIFGLVNLSSQKEKAYDDKDTKFFNAIVNQASMTIEGVLYEREKKFRVTLEAEREKTIRELKMAKYVQKGLLPKNLPNLKGYQVASYNNACQEVGGDFYHFIPVAESCWGFVIGDVAGKGIPAALLMAMGNTLFYEYGKNNRSPAEVLSSVNRALLEQVGFKPPFYLTAFYGIVDGARSALVYAKAGHNPPILYAAAEKQIVQLDADGTFLGIFEDAKFVEKDVDLKEGDFLILYTDGITEFQNVSGEMFGLSRLEELVKDRAALSAQQLIDSVKHELEVFSGGRPARDDITMIVIKKSEQDSAPPKPVSGRVDIPADRNRIRPVFDQIMAELKFSEKEAAGYRLAFSEALRNAIEHGAKMNDSLIVKIEYDRNPDRVRFVITDPGTGFNTGLDLNQDDPLRSRGRGLILIKSIMDEVSYNDTGNQVTMIKYLNSQKEVGL